MNRGTPRGALTTQFVGQRSEALGRKDPAPAADDTGPHIGAVTMTATLAHALAHQGKTSDAALLWIQSWERQR